jgi:hypothetical protein
VEIPDSYHRPLACCKQCNSDLFVRDAACLRVTVIIESVVCTLQDADVDSAGVVEKVKKSKKRQQVSWLLNELFRNCPQGAVRCCVYCIFSTSMTYLLRHLCTHIHN